MDAMATDGSLRCLLRNEGWQVNHKRVERIWRQEGLKVPKKQPKKGWLWLTDGSCVRLRPERKDHVRMFSINSMICSSAEVHRIIYGRIAGRNLRQKL